MMSTRCLKLQRNAGLQGQHGITRTRIGRSCPAVASAAAVEVEDKWISRLVQSSEPAGDRLQALKGKSMSALATLRMPSTRNEEYRFTDVSPLLKANVQVAAAGAAVDASHISAHVFPEAASSYAVVVDGSYRPELSNVSAVPSSAYVGSVAGAPIAAAQALGTLSSARGGPFAVVNGGVARDALCVVVPPGVEVTAPIYVLYLTSGGKSQGELSGAAPRLLVHAGKGSIVEVIEEYVGADASNGNYLNAAVTEVFVEESAQVKHGYVQREALASYHFKSTMVQQAESSHYTMTEACVKGGMSRHDLGIQQTGPETITQMRHFLLAGSNQVQDLHSKLELNHPRGEANQLHKCIVSHASGKGVFDGNVKVNKLAQKTDAGQLSRNLLLVPKATVNVKPNLQIIADDVKCTHGCAVSDLRDEELFYFRARGIDAATARQSLVFSFGSEVVQGLKYPALKSRVQADVSATLRTVEQFAE